MILFEEYMVPSMGLIFWNEVTSIKNWKETLGSRNLGLMIKYDITVLSFNYSKSISLSPLPDPTTNDLI